MKNKDKEVLNNVDKNNNQGGILTIILLLGILLLYVSYHISQILFWISLIGLITILIGMRRSWKTALKILLEGIIFAVILIAIAFGACFLFFTSMA